MSGERDLAKLHRQIAPRLHSETFVYCCFADFRVPTGLEPICTFREAEGLTAIVLRTEAARLAIPYLFESRLITLTVHSSLDAVGFLASVAESLTNAGIPCNVVAAYHHDHLFVPPGKAEEALQLLSAIAALAV